MGFLRQLSAAVVVVFSGCMCGPQMTPDASVEEPDAGPRMRRDAGTIEVLPTDSGTVVIVPNAGEPCPAEAFGRYQNDDGGYDELPDGGLQFGICAVTRHMVAQALLNDQPVAGNVRLEFIGGFFSSNMERTPDAFGKLDIKVLRNVYDILRYEPGTVFATHRGFIDEGPIDLTKDQERRLAARKHTLFGSALFSGLPFRPSTFPPDIRLEAYGQPMKQEVEVTSNSGSYQVDLLEGSFAVFLTTPQGALPGSQLRGYQLNDNNLDFTHDSVLDIDLPVRLLEGEVTFDGKPIPDRIPNAPDYVLQYVKTGQSDYSVTTYHEGGVSSFSGVMPAGQYSVSLELQQAPDRTYPSQMFKYQVGRGLDMTQNREVHYNVNFVTVEGSLRIDSQPVRLMPNATWKTLMYSFAGMLQTDSAVIYEVPLDSASFLLRTPPSDYYVAVFLDDTMADDLVNGFHVINKRMAIQGNITLPINIETTVLTGRLLIDGKPPPDGLQAGRFVFRNRRVGLNQNSIYFRTARTAGDGSFRVRIPKGEYEVFFEIDRDTFPDYAAGRQTVVGRVVLDDAQDVDIAYDTIPVAGPIRLDGNVIPDLLGGDDVTIGMRRDDGRDFVWGFRGGKPNFFLRAPKGRYLLDFQINRGAIDQDTAWGSAPMGMSMPVGVPPDDLMVGR